MSGKYKTYPAYKDSGVEWLGDVPEHWDVWKLNHFAPIITCGVAATPDYIDDGVIFLSAQNVKNRSVDLSKGFKYISKEKHTELTKNREPKNGDILLSRVGTVGEVCIVDVDFEFSIFVSLTHLRLNQKICTNRFFVFLCESTYTKSLHSSVTLVGGGVGNLNVNDLREYRLPLPSQDEQQKIAQFLNHETAKIDTLIEKQQRLIELLKEKRQAVISHAVTKGLNPNAPMKDSGVEWLGEVPEGWEVIQIKHLSSVKRGASPRPIDDAKYFDDEGEYAWVRIADVSKAGMYLTSTTQRLSKLGSSLSVKLEPNQIFVSIAGTVGKPCLTISKACIHDGFVYFPDLPIDNKFLYYIFEAGEAYLGLGKMGTQLNLNTETVGGIKIGLPPVQEIALIIEFIEQSNEKYDDLINKSNQSIELMQERRTALISAAVTGKIDVRNWDVL